MKVFWSWQSDTPGKIGRHFVRDAIKEAIADLKMPPDIEEPTQGADREALHLDSDRQGVSGSPDLAGTIFSKIDAAAVVVADVTPVGRGSPRKADDGSDLPGRALMNPNVAIELGYALSKPGEGGGNRLLMVFNGHYGTRSDLPFDLAHKAGPMFFHLPPDASSEEIVAERKKLRHSLRSALKPFLEQSESQRVPVFEATPTGANSGVWFRQGAVLGEAGDPRFGDVTEYTSAVSPIFYLRLMPSVALPAEFTRTDADTIGLRLGYFSGTGGAFSCPNSWGVAGIEPVGAGGEVASVVQLFLSGEIWAVNAALLSRFQAEQQLWIDAVETILQTKLPLLLDIMLREVKAALPIKVEVGFIGVKGRTVLLDQFSGFGTIRNDPEPISISYNTDTPAARTALLLSIFERIFRVLVQERRPAHYRGFPGEGT